MSAVSQSQARRVLGYEPRLSLEQGIKDSVEVRAFLRSKDTAEAEPSWPPQWYKQEEARQTSQK